MRGCRVLDGLHIEVDGVLGEGVGAGVELVAAAGDALGALMGICAHRAATSCFISSERMNIRGSRRKS